MVLLGCTILYVMPRTAILGAILLTAYLGGATAINFRMDGPIWFSIIFGGLIWTGLSLRDATLRGLLLGRRS